FILADLASLAGKLFRIPAIFVLHGGNLPEFTKRHPLWIRRVLQRAEILVAPSTFLVGEIERFGFKVRVIPNVIDLTNYPYKLRRKISPKLFWMRSFHPIYNPQMALGTLAAVKRTDPGATLVMAGVDKGLENSIKDSAEKMG